jgi:glycolate oxidase FAD binding subunit
VGVALEPAAFALGGRVPREVHTPASVEALADLLRTCDERGDAVVLFGNGTLQGIGNPPARYDVAISLAALARTLEYEFRDMTVAVEAGLTVAELDSTLAEQRQFVPLDAPRATHTTVGGVLASGWLGPRRATYGRPRDLVIGSTVVLADGTVAKAGGMVVKNVTGYDMSKLYIGSLGSLAAIVRANLKTLPLPETRRVAIAALPEGTRERALAHVIALDVEPTAALFVHGFADEIDGRDGTEGRLFLLFEGSRVLVDRATRELRSSLGAAGLPTTKILDREAGPAFARVLDAYVERLDARSATYRSGGLMTDLVARHQIFADLAGAHGLELETIGDLRTGDFIARLCATTASMFADRVAEFDPALRSALERVHVLAAPPALYGQLDPWGPSPPALAKMRAVKARFDPKNTLAPGRLVGGI